MNRNDNLLEALKSWIECERVSEIIIVDWNSEHPVSETLSLNSINDERIKIVRNEKAEKWNLCEAYNLGFRNVSKEYLLKLDADVCLDKRFFEKHMLDGPIYFSGSWKTARNEEEKRLNGSFFTKTKYIFMVGGYNEIIDTYGWDDSDLYSRMANLLDHCTFDVNYIYHIEQTPESRIENSKVSKSLKNLHASIYTELEIRKNEWKSFFNLPKLPLSFSLSYPTSVSDNQCYRLAIINEMSKTYEDIGLGFDKSLLMQLSLDALRSVLLFRHSEFSWLQSYEDVLKSLSRVPFLKGDLNVFISNKYSPYLSSSYKGDKYPSVLKNDFLGSVDTTDKNVFCWPHGKTGEIFDRYFYLDEISLKSASKRIVIPIVVFKAEGFIHGLIEDLCKQTAFEHCLFVFVIADGKNYALIDEFCSSYDNNSVRVSLTNDPGLYDCWNYVLQASGCEYASNWNVDDRRAPEHISSLVAFLDSEKKYDAACAALYVSRQKNKTFSQCLSTGEESWFNDMDFEFNHSDLFQTMWWLPDTDPSRDNVTSQNFLHCMPVWRTAIHAKNGYFNELKYGASADWEFWLRCGKNGSKYFKSSKTLGVYFLNEASYGRATEGVQIKEERIIKDYISYSKVY